MPEKLSAASDPFAALDQAWGELATANEALLAVNAAGSGADVRAASRLLLGVLRERTQALLRAVEGVQEATNG